MAGRTSMVLCMTIVVAASMLHTSLAQETEEGPGLAYADILRTPFPPRAPGIDHVVSTGRGWTVPAGGDGEFQIWASGQGFMVGDILVFNFPSGAHDVAEVSRTEYDLCKTNPNTNIITNGPARVTITSAGERYYICTVPNHCQLGQRLVINVTDVGGATLTSPSSITPAPSPNNSASSFGATLLFLFTLLAVALAFLFS